MASSNSISAADLARMHGANPATVGGHEDIVDPFPSLGGGEPTPAVRASSSRPTQAPSGALDTASEAAFPSLAAPALRQPDKAPAKSKWTAGSAAVKGKGKAPAGKPNGTASPGPAIAKQVLPTDTLVIESPVLQPKQSVGDVCRIVMKKHGVNIDPSSQMKSGRKETTFLIKASTAKLVEEARKSLVSMLSPVITLTIDAPVSTIGRIVGPKGAALKALRDEFNVRVDIPRRETLHTNGDAATLPANGDADEVEEPTLTVTINGPAPGARHAYAHIHAIVAEKTSRTSTKVPVPRQFWPFLSAKKDELEAGQDVKITIPKPYHPTEEDDDATAAEKSHAVHSAPVIISGERNAVALAADRVKAMVNDLELNTKELAYKFPKRQHRFLVGEAARKIVEDTGCSVELPAFDDPSEEVVIRGPEDQLPIALGAVMKQANTASVLQVDLNKIYPTPPKHAHQLLMFLTRSGRLRKLGEAHPGVKFFAPRQALVDSTGGHVVIDIVGDNKALVQKGRDDLDAAVKQLTAECFDSIEIEPLTHKFLIGKKGQKLRAFQDAHGVDVLFPHEGSDTSTVLLVYTHPMEGDKKTNEAEIRKRLAEVKAEMAAMEKEAADMKTETLKVDKKWHRFIVGQGGTTLNGIIGEEKAIIIRVGSNNKPGAHVKDNVDEDSIVIRGPKDQVERATKEILQIVEDAKNDDIVNGFTEEFHVNREFIARIVGTGGSSIKKIRDELGVRIDIDEQEPAGEEVKGKKKKAPSTANIKIVGRKENVLKAKERISEQVDRMADETTEILKIPAQYHPSLIGQGGKYAIRLEEKYGVKITFPKEKEENDAEGRKRDPHVGKDEVLLRGGRKGVAGVKAELLETVEFEKETNNVLKFTVPQSAISRIVGKGGQQINEIKDQTNTHIDIDRENKGGTTGITVKGGKKETEAAKKAILAIAAEVDDEVTVIVAIEQKYHRTIIGVGGQGLRDLIGRCGGPADPRTQAGLVQFPRQGESQDEVRLRGKRVLVDKIKVELEKVAEGLRDRVVLAVSVPIAVHSALIGRGGKRLQELQESTGAQIQFPGSRSYGAVGDAENADEVKDSEPQDVVKVYGSRAACAKAIAEIKKGAETFAASPAHNRTQRAPQETSVKAVPLKYHHVISQGGAFFRSLRAYGVTVDHSTVPEKPEIKPPTGGSQEEARIDQPVSPSEGAQWDIVPNYQHMPEGDAEWTIKAKSKEGLERAEKELEEAIKHAATYTHIGFLTLPNRTMFPRIVGSKGSTITRLREETGANIDVGRDNNTIMITGSEDSINRAKEVIEKILEGGRGRDY
ncbi:hypothetical protein DACRYDRAFT_20891 [Dacryopinax primogenitus]|uniref:K Homology domain-containing protein n=1 Tax=Dacryopinax primogenitus (strain DJM 731) TaxID=1858805 RepID=M5GD77_DACPD|nr:uncharacterized protein DACRYDRAFT_20891 [Dacryopinax primogenitus]EJU04322.1 hypothetical protein DACRYDRAFT_20891 [Dacryopinax primogenitus]